MLGAARIPHRRSQTGLVALAVAAALSTGCSHQADYVVTVADVAPALPLHSHEAPVVKEVVADVVPAVASSVEPSALEYTPPFPDRVDLFVPPKRPAAASQDARQRDAVELMGFVRVDRPRAVLSIDGNVASIPVGETQFGVQVLSINPPKVELQRDRQRWQATLE